MRVNPATVRLHQDVGEERRLSLWHTNCLEDPTSKSPETGRRQTLMRAEPEGHA